MAKQPTFKDSICNDCVLVSGCRGARKGVDFCERYNCLSPPINPAPTGPSDAEVRDRFAAAALTRILEFPVIRKDYLAAATSAYDMADAMMARRKELDN